MVCQCVYADELSVITNLLFLHLQARTQSPIPLTAETAHADVAAWQDNHAR